MMISGRADYMDGGMNAAMEMGMGGGIMNGRGAYRPPERGRGICRDYHSVYINHTPCLVELTSFSAQIMVTVHAVHSASTAMEKMLSYQGSCFP